MASSRRIPAPALNFSPEKSRINFANAILFNLSWFAIVITHSAVIAPAVVLLHCAVHVGLLGARRRELLLIFMVLALGLLVDQLLFRMGVFTILGQAASPPVWMTCLWPVLATTLMHAFKVFQHRPVLSALLGAVSGALSYTAGTRLTDVAFFSEVWGPVVLGGVWAVLFPLLLLMAAKLEEDADVAIAV